MSYRLSDAGRFLRGLTQLSQQIINEATKSGDPRRRSSYIIEPLTELISNGFDQLTRINISNTISKTTWKSSVLIRQSGIAMTNAIRSSPPSTRTFVTQPIEDRITTATILNRDKILIPTLSEKNLSTVTRTNNLVQEKVSISAHPPIIDTPTVKTIITTTSLATDQILISAHPKIDSTPVVESSPIEQKSEQLISDKVIDNVPYHPTEKPVNFFTPTTTIDSVKVKSTSSTIDEPTSPLILEENQNLISIPPPTNMEAQARSVPTTRIGRLASFGSLAAGLGVGALGSIVRRSVGLETVSSNAALSPYLSKANAERIVNTLCKVRGAALKLGQMISIQDNFLIQEDVQQIFERVRQQADFMPEWQMNEVMTNEFGANWRDQFEEFHDRPFAAASIGQVHYGILKDNKRRVAVKIQYPGVGKSIESDINNLVALLNFWNIIPRGLYIETVIKVAKRELNWEVDYIREADWGRRFQYWFRDYPLYRIPDIIDNLSTKNVLTTTYFDGITLDKAVNADQETRDLIGKSILEVCLLELFKFKAMQTDPNWSNFLYNPIDKTIGLIDFGASRTFNPIFIDTYIKIIRASADNDPERIRDLSVKCGFLTGYETREMVNAHVDAVMILGEGFRTDDKFDFGLQSTTKNIHKLIPVMLKHRLTPPPEDSYSLHRKMSGAFLLCTKLRSKVYCKPLFERIWKEYKSS
ncbi:unnamed protein product [Rotaria sp. Silwood2]|nr:unnamed protein product [Rotaria sp. Silwood2]CAF4181281.1 unnamed protein product [Rotaria sp. Silwood2]CAF4320438.1 unnamed protein product [Rotaria sp. Silwood2]